MSLKSALLSFINKIIDRNSYVKDHYGKPKFVGSLSDVPKDPGSKIYIVGDRDRQKWVAFACPNHCGKRIEVNLMKSRRPFWLLTLRNDKVSISPSVIVYDCGAHFFLRDNRIEWALDSVME